MAMGCPHQGRSGGLNATITSRPFDSPRPSPGGYDDALDEREAPSGLAEQSLGAVAVLYAGGVDVNGQQQANCIRQNVALAAKHLLASVIAGRVERSPPLTAPFAVGCP